MNSQLDVSRPRIEKANSTYYLLKRSEGILNIVECGFLSNTREAGLLESDEYQDKVAKAVRDGILTYLGDNRNEFKMQGNPGAATHRTVSDTVCVYSCCCEAK